ncbi:MAG TPA: TonB-dependent siderophore receptor [Bryobacteraceae bacterium]
MAKKRIKKKQAGRRRWLAVSTLAAYTFAGSGKLALAQKQTASNSFAAPNTQYLDGLPVRRYDLAPGNLDTVAREFEKVAGVTVTFLDSSAAQVMSPGVSGVYTATQALDKLLENTGVTYRVGADKTIRLSFRAVQTVVEVQANSAQLAASTPKFTEPLLNTPQTIGVVSRQIVEQQGAATLRDALRNIAGISLAAGEGGSQGDNLTIRGFTARNDLFIDGMRDFGSYYRDPFNTQEIEVLQGPSSAAFGRGSTGGVVNQATKTPDLNRYMSAGLSFGTDLTRRGVIDLNIPIPKLGSGAAFRLNAMGNINDVAGRDVAKNRRDGIAPSLSLGLGTPTRLTLSYFHQNADDIPDYGIPWLFNGPAPVNRRNYYGLANGNYLRTYDDIGTARLEHDVNSHITVRNQLRYANYARNVLITEPRINDATPTIPLTELTVTRNQLASNSTETFLDEQLDMSAHFETGRIRHNFVAGFEAGRETSNPTRPKFTAPDTSLLSPDPTQSLFGNPTISSSVTDTAISTGVYAVDTAKLGRHWELTGGVRFDRFSNDYAQRIAPFSSFHRVDTKPTWRGAISYHPVANGTLYFAAGTSFNPSAESLALSAGSANLPPESNKSYEFGTKWSLAGGHLAVNSSWFRTTKENARETDPSNSLLVVLAGTQRVSGAEVDITGHINSRWDILSSYAYLDSRVVGSRFFPDAIGYPLANVPKNTFAFWSNYRLPAHFHFGIGSNYVSSRTASSTTPLDPATGLAKQVPGYWVFNAMVSHPVTEHIDLQVNAYNLANRYYYDQLHPGHIVLGPGRSVLAGIKFKF